jgi:ornithine cyclodeaminase
MIVLTKSDVKMSISMSEAIDVMKKTFADFYTGKTVTPLRTAIRSKVSQGGNVLFMPGYIEGTGIALKAISIFPKNPEIGKPSISAIVLLQDEQTGETLALMEGAAVTAIRTGATSGVATYYLARKEATTVAVIGCGVQATTQLEAICCVRHITEVMAYDTDKERISTYIDLMSRKFPEIKFAAAKNPNDAVKIADIVITATTSPKPVFSASSLKTGAHINAIGSYTPDVQELPEELFDIADKIVVDSKEAVLAEAGDFIIPINKRKFSPSKIDAELGQLSSGQLVVRETEREITLFKTVGIAAQDVACAAKIYNNAVKKGLGTKISMY